ncbi:MAG: helix-turn-helix domain-containing protein [Candidatus Bathyarchaeia archaeon]
MEVLSEKPESVVKLYDENAGLWKYVRKDKGPLKSLEIIENTFSRLGLSKNEVRVYLFLARSGMRKASEISEGLSLHRTETYRILRDLEKRGLVSAVFEKPLKFIATSFDKALDVLIKAKKMKIALLEKKKKDLVDLWLSLPQPEIETEQKEVFQILEGEEQINLKADEILEHTEKEIFVFSSDHDLARLYHSGFLDKLEQASKRVRIHLLIAYSPKSCFFVERMKLNNVNYSFTKMEGLPSFIISDMSQVLFSIKANNNNKSVDDARRKREKLSALWTNYEAFAKVLRTLFLELWNARVPLSVSQITH